MNTSMVTLRRDMLIVVRPFVTHRFYCSQDCIQECEWAHGTLMLPIAVLAWATFRDSYSVTFWVAAEKRTSETKILVVRS